MNLLLSIVYFQGFQAFFLPILNEMGWSRTLLSGAFSLRQVENGLLSPVVGMMVDRWGVRKIIFWGVILAGVGMALLSQVREAVLFYVAFAIISAGMSGPGHSISWAAAVANWFRRQRGRALGLATLGPVLSGPFVFLVVMLEEAVGWRTAILMLTALLVALGVPLALVARHRPEPYGLLPDGDPPALPLVPGPESLVRAGEAAGLSPREAVRTAAFWMICSIYGIQGLCHSGLMAHVLPLFQSLGLSARDGAAVLGMIFFLSAFGRIAAGFLTDYLDRRVVLAVVIVLHATAFGLGTVMTAEWPQVALFALMYGVGFGSAIPARPLIVRQLFGARSFGTINGFTQGANFGAGVIGPLVLGATFDLLGTYRPGIAAFAGLILVSLPLLLLLRAPAGGLVPVSKP